jgi:hypothetical protein
VARPLAWIDRVLSFWRRISPLAQLAAVPLGLMIQRAVFPRLKILRTLVLWSPLLFGAARLVGRTFSTRARPS